LEESSNRAIRGWDARAVRIWVREHIRKPAFTCDDFTIPYAAYGLTKVARKQGEWAAKIALRILDSTRPYESLAVCNHLTRCLVNPKLAAKIGFSPPRTCAARQ
jgi:hypothetical protein